MARDSDARGGRVSTAVNYLVGKGYVNTLPCAGAEPTQYVRSGVSRLIFG